MVSFTPAMTLCIHAIVNEQWCNQRGVPSCVMLPYCVMRSLHTVVHFIVARRG